MTSRPLPDDGPAREIFVRALRAYSDNCEPPDLTPDCPFSMPLLKGGRGCGEECMDLLAEFDHATPPGTVELGAGYAIRPRRPRSRRGPEVTTKPYDAAEIALGDETEKDLTKWQTVSLMFELRARISTSPTLDPTRSGERLERIRACWSELATRGFDVELLVREGMNSLIATGIALALIVPDMIREADSAPDDDALGSFEMPPGWSPLFEECVAQSAHIFNNEEKGPFRRLAAATAGGFHDKLSSWIMTANMENLLSWVSPTPDRFFDAPPRQESDRRPHRWLVDRFLSTYLTEWDTGSLHAEWEYAHGHRTPPCPTAEMKARRIDASELGNVIADRVVYSSTKESESGTLISPRSYTRIAAKYLTEGRRSAAAAVFEATREVAPSNAEIQNNYGFCILPDRPDEALAVLELAASLGFEDNAANAGDRMYALLALGRLTSALEVAENFVTSHWTDEPSFAWMWAFDGALDAPEFIECDDVRAYVLDLAVLTAQKAGDDSLIERWRTRRRALLDTDARSETG
jgi:hypothetical protein